MSTVHASSITISSYDQGPTCLVWFTEVPSLSTFIALVGLGELDEKAWSQQAECSARMVGMA